MPAPRNKGRISKLQKEINAIHYRVAQQKRRAKEEAEQNPRIYTGNVKFTAWWHAHRR